MTEAQTGNAKLIKTTIIVSVVVVVLALIGLGIAALLAGESSLPFDYGGFGN